MYYPYLRGKQYELLALREFAASASKPGHLWPVLEPVRDPSMNTSLARAMSDMDSHGMVCERVAAQTVLLAPDESPVRMVLLAHRACLTSPLMDIVIGRGEG